MSEVIDAPAPATAETNLGDVYTTALNKAQSGGEEATPAPEEQAEEAPVPAKEEVAPAKAKQTSALESVLNEPEKKEDVVESDPLKDLPEELPNKDRGENWKKARTAIKSLSEFKTNAEKTIAELQSKAQQTGQLSPEQTARLEKAEAENAQLRDAITAANVELLPEFRAKYVEGAKALIGKAQEKAKAYGGDPEALAVALHLPEGLRREQAISEAMGENVSDLGRAKINSIIAEFDNLNEAATAERANAQQSYERLTQKQQDQRAAQEQEIEGRKRSTFDAVTKQLQATIPTLRSVDATLTGAEDWNNGVKSAFANAERLFGPEAKAEDTVVAAIKGSDYDRVAGLLTNSLKEAGELRRQLAELQGAQPDARGSRPATKTGKDALLEQDPGKAYEEAMAKLRGED